jgi:hypothetical protein
MSNDETAAVAPDVRTVQEMKRGERRLPMALAVVAVGVLSVLIPEDFRIARGTAIAYPIVLLVLLGILIIGDPGRIDRDVPWLRTMTGVLITVITFATFVSVVRLVLGILHGAKWDTAGSLLEIGAIVLVTNMIAFALLFWHLDAGGPAARFHGRTDTRRAFAFPEVHLPELEGVHWYPQFVDYFALSFNTCTAFSPTDVSAVRHWAKLLMILESSMSLVIVTLVLAQAINQLGNG